MRSGAYAPVILAKWGSASGGPGHRSLAYVLGNMLSAGGAFPRHKVFPVQHDQIRAGKPLCFLFAMPTAVATGSQLVVHQVSDKHELLFPLIRVLMLQQFLWEECCLVV